MRAFFIAERIGILGGLMVIWRKNTMSSGARRALHQSTALGAHRLHFLDAALVLRRDGPPRSRASPGRVFSASGMNRNPAGADRHLVHHRIHRALPRPWPSVSDGANESASGRHALSEPMPHVLAGGSTTSSRLEVAALHLSTVVHRHRSVADESAITRAHRVAVALDDGVRGARAAASSGRGRVNAAEDDLGAAARATAIS